ncbi:Retrovirus-related Pol polyprotein from transposon, partial [Dictyocoela roeselum]
MMDDNSIPYTAFWVKNKKYEWLRMLFGPSNAPKTFQRIMDKLFEHSDNAIPYLDDIIIFSKTQEEHVIHLEHVIKILKDNNIKINKDKCEFFKGKIEFLGHYVSSEGVMPVSEHLSKKIQLNPGTRKLQRVLGLLNYYRDFIPNFSSKTLFITEKLSSKDKFTWTEQDVRNLKSLVSEVETSHPFRFPNNDEKFCLFTDASNKAVGAVLKQSGAPIGYYSHKFPNSELNYSILEKEALSVLNAVQYFRSILITNKVLIYTDNKNLLFEKDLTNRIQRWKLLLEEYNY